MRVAFSPKTLASAMSLESFAGVHFPTCETIARQLVAALQVVCARLFLEPLFCC